MDHIDVTEWRYEYMHTAMRYWIYRNSKLVCSTDQEGDARRIVACVNACAGLSIEALESDVAKDVLMNFASTIIEFDLLKKQNRELLEALEKINRCQADGIAPDDPGGWMDFFIETARAAIAKATNQTT